MDRSEGEEGEHRFVNEVMMVIVLFGTKSRR